MFYQVKVLSSNRDFFWDIYGFLIIISVKILLTIAHRACFWSKKFSQLRELRTQTARTGNFSEEIHWKGFLRRSRSLYLQYRQQRFSYEITQMLSNGGVNLAGFISNSTEVLASLPPEKFWKYLNCLDITSRLKRSTYPTIEYFG